MPPHTAGRMEVYSAEKVNWRTLEWGIPRHRRREDGRLNEVVTEQSTSNHHEDFGGQVYISRYDIGRCFLEDSICAKALCILMAGGLPVE